MAIDIPSFNISTLEQMYIDSCKRHGVLPNTEILSGFLKAEVKKSCNEICSLEIILDHLEDIDVPPLLDVCANIETSEIEVVDIRNGPNCALHGEYALSLMRAFIQKLQVVDLQDLPFGKDFLRELSQKGLACQILNLRSSHFRNLNMAGKFMQIHTLNLDFSTSLTSFQEDCFACMPILTCLSMCETRVANLWTTIAALSKLSSLVELRFQKWICCNDSAFPSASSGGNLEDQPDVRELLTDIDEESYLNQGTDEATGNVFSFDNIATGQQVQSMMEDSSDDNEVDFSSYWQEFDYMDMLANFSSGWNRQVNLQSEVMHRCSFLMSWSRVISD